ncbi:MAG: M14 family zinc carboxypeptidase [Balneolales bacterium]
MNLFKLTLCLLFLPMQVFAQQSPAEFLGYEPGDRFTPQHRVADYFQHLAQNLDNVELHQYGKSYEHRPLTVAFLLSPENMSRLEEIRTSNIRLTGLKDGEAMENQPAIVWLSYNIHGNESVSTESAMQTLYGWESSKEKLGKRLLAGTLARHELSHPERIYRNGR